MADSSLTWHVVKSRRHCKRDEAISIEDRDCFVAEACPERSGSEVEGAPRNDGLASSDNLL